MVLAYSHRITRVLWYSGYPLLKNRCRLRDFHSLWSNFPDGSTTNPYCNVWVRNPFNISTKSLGSFHFARHYSGNRYLLSFPPVNEMFQFTGFPSIHYLIRVEILCLQHSEFPHSEICGSIPIYGSPQLIAVSHVLHRRLVPRHPPYALCSLIV